MAPLDSQVKRQLELSDLAPRAMQSETGVAAVAGSAFFRAGEGENLLRFCFSKKDAELAEACKRLRGRV
jgi:aminotransferase